MSRLAFFLSLFLAGISRTQTLQLAGSSPTTLLHRAGECLDLLPKEALTERTGASVPESPSWLPQDWFDYLVNLTDFELATAEAHGLCSLILAEAEGAKKSPPRNLLQFAQALRDLDRQLLLPPPPLPPQTSFSSQEVPGVKVRKLAQLDAFAAAVLAVKRSENVGSDKDRLTASEPYDASQAAHRFKVSRIVDVGCGVGHLTRALAEKLGTEGLGLEVDLERVATAQSLTVTRNKFKDRRNQRSDGNDGSNSSSCVGSRRDVSRRRIMPADQAEAHDNNDPQAAEVAFEVCDATAPGEVASRLQSGDIVVGLHPCGALGDALVAEVAAKATGRFLKTLADTSTATSTSATDVAPRSTSVAATSEGAIDEAEKQIIISSSNSATAAPLPLPPALLMVSCCLAGRTGVEVPAERPAISATGRSLGIALPRAALKKTNITPVASRGSAAESNLKRREARLAMRLLLRSRGIHHLLPGAEMDGLPKRARSATTVARLFFDESNSEEASMKELNSSEDFKVGSVSIIRAPEIDCSSGKTDDKSKIFSPMANYALAARGLESLSPGEDEAIAKAAREALPALRRLELLDGTIGDAVELIVNLDRACVLEETGKFDVRIGRLFPKAVSPRNLAIYAWPKMQC